MPASITIRLQVSSIAVALLTEVVGHRVLLVLLHLRLRCFPETLVVRVGTRSPFLVRRLACDLRKVIGFLGGEELQAELLRILGSGARAALDPSEESRRVECVDGVPLHVRAGADEAVVLACDLWGAPELVEGKQRERKRERKREREREKERGRESKVVPLGRLRTSLGAARCGTLKEPEYKKSRRRMAVEGMS